MELILPYNKWCSDWWKYVLSMTIMEPPIRAVEMVRALHFQSPKSPLTLSRFSRLQVQARGNGQEAEVATIRGGSESSPHPAVPGLVTMMMAILPASHSPWDSVVLEGTTVPRTGRNGRMGTLHTWTSYRQSGNQVLKVYYPAKISVVAKFYYDNTLKLWWRIVVLIWGEKSLNCYWIVYNNVKNKLIV